jgi:glycosyltransferase involved in cell wall biosynthesis
VKFLFVHQNFPGQFLHILRHLVTTGSHEIVFITEPNTNVIPGVRKVPYRKPPTAAPQAHPAARELDGGVRRADAVFKVAASLRALGFEPDIMIGHHGWGEMLNLIDVWPGKPLYGYYEFYYNPERADVGFDPEFPNNSLDYPRIRAKNAINHIALNLGQHGHSPTRWQWSTYPDWAQQRIDLLWEGVDLDICRPQPTQRRKPLTIGDMTIKATDKLVTYVSRDLEPYRGFHLMMRTLPLLQRARKDLKVVMVGSDGVSYGVMPQDGTTWRERLMKEVGDQIDLSRVVFPGRIPYEQYLALMKRSDAHVYLTYPFVASWSLRESLAMGCAVIGSDTQPVQEFITHGENGLLTSFFDPPGLARSILDLLENKALDAKLRANARAYAEKNLSMDDYIAAYRAAIERLVGRPIDPEPVAPRRNTATTKAVNPPTEPVVKSKAGAKPKPAVKGQPATKPAPTSKSKPARPTPPARPTLARPSAPKRGR